MWLIINEKEATLNYNEVAVVWLTGNKKAVTVQL